jgi:hypothetical protein
MRINVSKASPRWIFGPESSILQGTALRQFFNEKKLISGDRGPE